MKKDVQGRQSLALKTHKTIGNFSQATAISKGQVAF